MKVRELRVVHGKQQSFYKKAFIRKDDEGIEYLHSYYSRIITNYGNALRFEEDGNLYSNTTMRHVREYLWQIGKGELAKLSKSNLFKELAKTNYIVLDIL